MPFIFPLPRKGDRLFYSYLWSQGFENIIVAVLQGYTTLCLLYKSTKFILFYFLDFKFLVNFRLSDNFLVLYSFKLLQFHLLVVWKHVWDYCSFLFGNFCLVLFLFWDMAVSSGCSWTHSSKPVWGSQILGLQTRSVMLGCSVVFFHSPNLSQIHEVTKIWQTQLWIWVTIVS